jgi:hypothetical protein
MASTLNVTELDFGKIKENIKNYFRNSSSAYADWDFEGSGLSTIIDVLAYNTYYNGVLAHMAMNETFLDSAQLRHNVVGHAKLLGYVPHSYKSPSAVISLTFAAGGSVLPMELPRGSQFTTSIDSVQYSFITLETYSAPAIDDVYSFPLVEIFEGALKKTSFIVDENILNQKFVIPDSNGDMTTLIVNVRENAKSTTTSTFIEFATLASADSNSAIYFISENYDGKYEISFGDGIFGKKLPSLSVVELEYLVTAGSGANFANSFSYSGGGSPIITTVSASTNGSSNESIESVRFNAPLALVAQNRAVTADDYKAIILRDFGAVDAINVWGGEQQVVPEYGKVFIAMKPSGGDVLSDTEKARVLTLLKNRNVLTITPILVDPDYVNIYLDIAYKYDSNATTLRIGELNTLVASAVSTYSANELLRFDGVFRNSKLLRAVDASSPAILNSAARVYLYKSISISNFVNANLNFATKIYGDISASTPILTSTSFIYHGYTTFVGDEPLSSTRRNLFLYRVDESGNKIKLLLSCGYATPSIGEVVITGFSVDTPQTLQINVVPDSFDIAPKRDQLLRIDINATNILGEVDSIAVGGSSGASSYITFPRSR